MTLEPRYKFPVGSELTLLQRPVVIAGQNENGYTVVGREDGETNIVPFGRLVEQLKLPGVTIDTALPLTGGRQKRRLGGHTTAHSLSDRQQEVARFRCALCEAIRRYSWEYGLKIGQPDFRPSGRHLDRIEVRKMIAQLAEPQFGKKIRVSPPRGGNPQDIWVVYKGRTLREIYQIFLELDPGESPLDALVSLDHLKGNQTPRICNFLRNMMTTVWEEIGLDLRSPKVGTVHKTLETRIWKENKRREPLGLPMLTIPSRKTLREHRDVLVTPTEYLIATGGIRHTKNKRGRGSTDYRALLVGELVEVDECKMSLVTSAKLKGLWARMYEDQRDALGKLDEYSKSRFWIVAMVDVASRMPLAWVITENPCAEATVALFRMATRDKTREKLMYGCKGEPAAAVGLLHVKNDNGSGLRNSTTVSALMGIGSHNTVTRTYSPVERPHVERFFGTLEIDVLNLLPGYTGGQSGAVPGYDAKANGVMTVEQLYEIVTRYFIDEYPSTRHHGVTMGGRRPSETYKAINETRGQIAPIDPHLRRISLGWEENVTPTDEGVRVFHGIWFNSDELQEQRDELGVSGKVKVFVDPDDMKFATVILPRAKKPIEVNLQTTAFADLTLPEILRLMAEQRREDPATTEFHEDQIMRTRSHRYDKITAIGVEHNLSRSYSTVEECKIMAKAVFAGARVVPAEPLYGTTPPGQITDLQAADGVYSIGGEDTLIDGVAMNFENTESSNFEIESSAALQSHEIPSSTSEAAGTAGKQKHPKKPAAPVQTLSRPKNLKGLK